MSGLTVETRGGREPEMSPCLCLRTGNGETRKAVGFGEAEAVFSVNCPKAPFVPALHRGTCCAQAHGRNTFRCGLETALRTVHGRTTGGGGRWGSRARARVSPGSICCAGGRERARGGEAGTVGTRSGHPERSKAPGQRSGEAVRQGLGVLLT